jgi:hypothetical protein
MRNRVGPTVALLVVSVLAFTLARRDPDSQIGGAGYVDAKNRNRKEFAVDHVPCTMGALRVDWPSSVTRRCEGDRWHRLTWPETEAIVLGGRVLSPPGFWKPSSQLDEIGPEMRDEKMSIYRAAFAWQGYDKLNLTIALRYNRLDPTALRKESKRWTWGTRVETNGYVISGNGNNTQKQTQTFIDAPTFVLEVSGPGSRAVATKIADLMARPPT